MNSSGSSVDEESPLICDSHQTDLTTPLPWSQVSIVLLVLLAEPMTSQVISPFAPELIKDLGVTHGDDSKIGYFVGLMQSLFFIAEALTILHWSRASDRYGRKPILMIGLSGLCISMIFFGMSRTFIGLVISRSLAGALNGNIGVVKSMLTDLTDSTNRARAFSFIAIVWSTGVIIGPLVGGYLSKPTEQFPRLFGGIQLLRTFPYLLPCLISAVLCASIFVIVRIFLREASSTDIGEAPVSLMLMKHTQTVDIEGGPNTPPGGDPPQENCDLAEEITQSSTSSSSLASPSTSSAIATHLPLQPVPSPQEPSLLTRRVILSTAAYALSSLGASLYNSFLPVFFSTPISLGGLGLQPSAIGIVMTVFGLLNGIVQICFFPRMNRRFGTKRLCFIGSCGFIAQFSMFPIENWLARHSGKGHSSTLVWVAVGVQIFGNVISEMVCGGALLYVSTAAPTRRMLGATNGLAQMGTSIMRAIGPALINSLFSLSIQKNVLGGHGYLVYVVQLVFVMVLLRTVALLPAQTWKPEEK